MDVYLTPVCLEVKGSMIKAMSSTSCLGKPNTTIETQKRVHMDDDNGGEFVTQEFHPKRRKGILRDRSTIYKEAIQSTKSSRILGPDLIGKDPDLRPFWNPYTKEISRQWSSCIETDSVLNLPNGSYERMALNSWFKVTQTKLKETKGEKRPNSLTTCCPLLTSLSPETMEDVRPRIVNDGPKVVRQGKDEERSIQGMMKYRLYPTRDQMTAVRKAFGVCTWTYNQALEGIRKDESLMTMKSLRPYCVNNKSELIQRCPWVTEIMTDMRDEAAHDVIRALKSCFTKRKRGRLKGTNAKILSGFRFRSKRDSSRVLVIHSKHYKSAGVFCMKTFGDLPFRSRERLPDQLDHDSKLQLTRTGKLYLLVPVSLPSQIKKRQEWTIDKSPVVAIDPGVRTFGTCYDGSYVTEWGKDGMNKIYRLGLVMDELKGKIAKSKNKRRRRNLEMALWRRRERKANLIRDFHYRFAHWLAMNYELILFPVYDTKSMVSKHPSPGKRRTINSKTVRNMMNWCPATFRDILMRVSSQYKKCTVEIVSEAFTSKTCGECGDLDLTLGGKKEFRCKNPRCGFAWDRDTNASRNILLRYITMSHMRL